MVDYNPDRYGVVIAGLIGNKTMRDLGPARPDLAIREKLAQFSAESLFAGRGIVDLEMAECCLAALWMYHDFLDESHRLSQQVYTHTGSYWHGIMHRREPDYPNAKYWFQRVGQHPIYPELKEAVEQLHVAWDEVPPFLLREVWDPAGFIDLCEQSRGKNDSMEKFCQTVQQIEWQILFDYSFRKAIGWVETE
ncbi:MAG: hypothetical protein RBU29_15945 [bacterium]|nr:hypothetical protein [bacterium]